MLLAAPQQSAEPAAREKCTARGMYPPFGQTMEDRRTSQFSAYHHHTI
jgi:hypothetical protein